MNYDKQIENLIKRVEHLEKEIDSLRNQIKDTIIEKNLYDTSSTTDSGYVEWDMDYGQQEFIPPPPFSPWGSISQR